MSNKNEVDPNAFVTGMMKAYTTTMKKLDGWKNIVSGLGTMTKDKKMHSKAVWIPPTEQQLEMLYAGEPMAEKIVDLPVDDAFSSGWKIKGIPPEQQKRLMDEANRLKIVEHLMMGLKKARLYGGAVILKIYEGDSLKLDEPVKGILDKQKNKTLRNLIILSRYDVWSDFEDINRDIFSERFGKPNFYTYYGRKETNWYGSKIHASRCIRLDGKFLPDNLFKLNGHWGDSVLNKLEEPIRNYATDHASVSAALEDFSVGVYKIKNLADQIAGDCEDKVLQRFQIINLAKSMIRAVVLDSEGEDFDYKVRNISGVKDLLEASKERLTASSGMPHTVLLGNSPTGGLGATGNHEEKNWNKWIMNFQLTTVKPPHLELLKEIASGIGIDPTHLDIEYHAPSEPTESEELDTRKKQAEIDSTYIDLGVVSSEEVRKSRFGGEQYSIETQIDSSLDDDLDNLDINKDE